MKSDLPSAGFSLLPIWLALTGGESGCPRLRFFFSIAVAYALFHALLPSFAHSLVLVSQNAALAPFAPYSDCLMIAGMVLGGLAVLLAFMPLPPLALVALAGSEALASELCLHFQGKAPLAAELMQPLWLNWAQFLLCTLVLLFCAAAIFGLAWRRLRDAGRSPLFLLLGLTYALAVDSNGHAADASGICFLGPLWLVILFCSPTCARRKFAIFRQAS